ncbi:MAG TPA: ABC transporter ATP-binding protein [Thermoanaerobaculia bacterium]|nr:ABC transporter ATP-binding protein [Thermoanaerobaculia bacterium]
MPDSAPQPRPPLLLEAERPMARLFAYLAPYRTRLRLGVSSSVLNKILDLMPPLLVGWVIDSLRGQPPHWIARLAGTSDAWSLAVVLAALSVAIFFFESLFQWGYQHYFMTLAQEVQHDLRLDAYERIQRREIAFFEEHRLGETLAMLNDDVNQLERFLNNGANELIQTVVLFAFSGFVLFDTSWRLALIAMAPIPLILWGSLAYQRRIAPRYKRVREAVGSLSSRLENNIAGILVIQSFGAEAFELDRVREASSEYREANRQAIRLSAIFVPVIRMAIVLGFAGILLIGSHWILEHRSWITVGQLVLFAMMTERLLWPLVRLGQVLDEYERARASARRTFGLLDTPSTIVEPAQPVRIERARGELELANVDFTYARGDRILDRLSFRIAPGETIGIAGPTGAGKSTLIKLLLRLYDPTGGAVKLDGHDLRDLALEDLRRSIALVSQDVYLFHGTLRENIAYRAVGVPFEKIVEAAKYAELHDFIVGLPDGYDTLVGERGIKLSGGQRQRLSIARAILKDAPILVLDEATSSVDTETERAIQENLRRWTAGRTALIIAHRLSTIRNADRILVLRDGRLAEEGTHDALIAKGGTYADLWHVQSGELVEVG